MLRSFLLRLSGAPQLEVAGSHLVFRLDEEGKLQVDGFDLTDERIAHALTGGVPSPQLLTVLTADYELERTPRAKRPRRLKKMVASARKAAPPSPLGIALRFHELDTPALSALASRYALPQPLEEAFARHPDRWVRACLITHLAPRHPSTWRLLSKDPDPVIREKVAGSDEVPLVVLESMLSDPEPLVRQALARHRPLRQHLIADAEETVRGYVAGYADPELIDVALQDPSPNVRSALLSQVGLEPAAVAQLSRDPDPVVRDIAARHPHLPISEFERLAYDRAPTVRAAIAVRAQGELLSRLCHHSSELVRAAVAGNPALDPDAMLEIARDDGDPDVQLALVGNPSLPPEIGYEILDRDNHALCRKLAAATANPELMTRLAQHRRYWSELARNPKAYPQLLLGIAAAANPGDAIIDQLLQHPRLQEADRARLREMTAGPGL